MSTPAVDPELLKLMCCPESHQKLRVAEPALIAKLNERIAARALKNRLGQPVTESLLGGLIREDGEFLYPVRQHPIMLVDEAIPL
jgi:uncharacterized protein YbaR (Trm112 family)